VRKSTTVALTAIACGALAVPATVAQAGSGHTARSAARITAQSQAHLAAALRGNALARAEQHAAATIRAAGTKQTASAMTSGSQPTVVVSRLNNPRQLSLLPSGDVLLVAEAGKGGPTCVGSGENQTCLGATGAISAVLGPQTAANTKPVRIVRHLLSGAGPDGSFAVGSDGVSSLNLNRIFIQETFAPPEAVPGGLNGAQLGKLLRAKPFGSPTAIANITAFEAANDPDHQGFDSDPYAVLVTPRRIFVADAAGNDVLQYNRHTGQLSLFKVLPNIQGGACAGQPNDNGTTGCDYVPTSLALTPSGHLLVGGLGGETPGAGQVREFTMSGHLVRVIRGLTTVTGVAADRRGNIYASELEGPGASPDLPGDLVRISRSGQRTSVVVPVPAGVAVDRSGNVFVSAFSIASEAGFGAPGTSGQVWRLRFPAGSGSAS
jgi:hypothetical protein